MFLCVRTCCHSRCFVSVCKLVCLCDTEKNGDCFCVCVYVCICVFVYIFISIYLCVCVCYSVCMIDL